MAHIHITGFDKILPHSVCTMLDCGERIFNASLVPSILIYLLKHLFILVTTIVIDNV